MGIVELTIRLLRVVFGLGGSRAFRISEAKV